MLAEVRLDDVDTRVEQRLVLVAPECTGIRIREVDDRLSTCAGIRW